MAVSKARVERLEARRAAQRLTEAATDAELEERLQAALEAEFAKLPPDMRDLAERITVAELDRQVEAELDRLTPAERDAFLRDFAAEHGLPYA